MLRGDLRKLYGTWGVIPVLEVVVIIALDTR